MSFDSRFDCLNLVSLDLTRRFSLLKRYLDSEEMCLCMVRLALRLARIKSRISLGISIECRLGLIILIFLVTKDKAFVKVDSS